MKRKKQIVVIAPRLPQEARVRLGQGSTHKNKKQYDRKKEKALLSRVRDYKDVLIRTSFVFNIRYT